MAKSYIQTVAMFCPLGQNSPAATAAMRAGFANFRESEYADRDGGAIVVSVIEDLPKQGFERYKHMLAQVLEECQKKTKGIKKANTSLILLLPEADRPGAKSFVAPSLAVDLFNKLGGHSSSKIYNHGKSAIAEAIRSVNKLLNQYDELEYVMIIAVDSYIEADTLEYFVGQQRVLITGVNNDGFTPGEGAGVVVFGRNKTNCFISGIGVGKEKAHILQEEKVNRGQGLSTAIQAAVADAGCALADCDFICSSCNGENYYFNEISLAISRCLERRKEKFPHLLLSNKLGETGVACGNLMLGYLQAILPRRDSYGKRAIALFSDDNGHRAALVVESA